MDLAGLSAGECCRARLEGGGAVGGRSFIVAAVRAAGIQMQHMCAINTGGARARDPPSVPSSRCKLHASRWSASDVSTDASPLGLRSTWRRGPPAGARSSHAPSQVMPGSLRFLSYVGRRDNERRKIAQCERTADNRLSLILPTRQLLDRFKNIIGPTSVEPV